MSKAIKLPLIMCVLFLHVITKAQTISLNVFQDLSTIDFAAFSFEKDMTNQPRILQIMIMPPGMEVFIKGSINWKKNESTGFQTVGTFITKNFISRSFFNDEIGLSDIGIKTSSYNSGLTKTLLEIGKPSGIIEITFILYNAQGDEIGKANEKFEFLNPTSPEILFPVSGSVVDIGSIPVSWTKSIGVSSYRVHANFIADNESNLEKALNSGNPIVNNRNVGNLTTINLRDYIDREIVADTNIVLIIRAVVEGPGGGELYSSAPVVFATSMTGDNQLQSLKPDSVQTNLILLSNILSGMEVNQSFLDDLANGKYSLDQLQFTDEYGNTITFSDFQNILNYLESNSDAIISVKYLSQ